MELFLVPKGSKFIVQDKKKRLLYTVKKKAFGGKFLLLDASGYELYSFINTIQGKKPEFNIILNDKIFMTIKCLSVFLDPSIEFNYQEDKFKDIKYTLKSSDRKNFTLFRNNEEVGSVRTIVDMDKDLCYEISIEDQFFDDYIPLFALAVERAFGDMNKNK